MCKKCSDAVKKAMDNGIPESEEIDWLWENTPFPIGDPTEEQLKSLSNLKLL